MDTILTLTHDPDAPLHEALADEAPALAALARRILGDAAEADDALQEAWLRAWRHKEALRDPAARRGWLRRIVVRECLRSLRWQALRRWLPFGEATPEALAPGDATASLDARRVRAAVGRLPAQQRLAFGLRFEEGWTLPEIAAAMDLSPETVKTHLGRALAKVRAEVADV